jgi:hypothetical protein
MSAYDPKPDTRGLWGLNQATAKAGTFRAHRIPVIRGTREPPCIGGQEGDAGSETGTTRNGRIRAA